MFSVWLHNSYPGLRLQGCSLAWRCFSLPPKWHDASKNDPKELYRPLGPEILDYIHQMIWDRATEYEL